tara:strand:- start:7113 stop:7484 length:372 start_codon:yes stop_codon:yes gene_type:complete
MTEDKKPFKPRPGGLGGVWPAESKRGTKYYAGNCTREWLETAIATVDNQRLRSGAKPDLAKPDDKFRVLVWVNDGERKGSPAFSVELGTPNTEADAPNAGTATLDIASPTPKPRRDLDDEIPF